MYRLKQRRISFLVRPSAVRRDVAPGGLVAVHADHGDTPQDTVRVAISTAVQPMPVGVARGHQDRRDTAQAGERPLTAKTSGIVSWQ
jgi:hypothetical protein